MSASTAASIASPSVQSGINGSLAKLEAEEQRPVASKLVASLLRVAAPPEAGPIKPNALRNCGVLRPKSPPNFAKVA